MAQKTQEEAVFDCFKQYPWLQDFCTYINKSEEELSWTEIYLRYAEIHWVNCLTSWDYTLDKAGMVEHMGLKGWKTIEGIPDSLLYHLIQVFDHLSGSSFDFKNRFIAWLEENYHVDSLQMKHRKGKRILNEYRLAFLEYKGDYENIERTPEMDYMFTIADGVDAEHGFDAPIDETEMCDAIEYAEENGYEIYLEPDEDDVRTKHVFGIHNHIRLRPKGSSTSDGITFD
ncbi:MAG: hypothetical protein IJE73_01105 [Muribaculaceae bacterium]|nr:hypothetical protein [Muribaculaceae bacterium]